MKTTTDFTHIVFIDPSAKYVDIVFLPLRRHKDKDHNGDVVVRIPPPTELGLQPINISNENDQCRGGLKVPKCMDLQSSITGSHG